jgi:hypothetical protein
MSNIAGKAYAMSLITPIDGAVMSSANKLIFAAIGTPLFKKKLDGLLTLSMIHYARWVIVRGDEFPRLSEAQPKEELKYDYMFFFSNFNGSWAQYIDSFSAAIPDGLDTLWWKNVGWPKAVPEEPFHRYVSHNQLFTSHYYSAYPMAASNDVKAAKHVKDQLTAFVAKAEGLPPDEFKVHYEELLKELQHDLGQMAATPIVSLANSAAEERKKSALRPVAPERMA